MMQPSLKKLLWAVVAGVAFATAAAQPKPQEFLQTYADIAHMNYDDSLADAKLLQAAVDQFVAHPTQQNLDAAKKAWLFSRENYGLSEIFRLSNGPIDAEEGWVSELYGNLESQINAWPLDENMIDYTIDADGKKTSGNIIDTQGKFTPAATEEKSTAVDVSEITVGAITELNENGGEANVASGYHAIEFLLWGQDQDYSNMLEDNITKGAMTAGQRPLSDFTTDKYAQRRLQYLKAATDKLVADLTTVDSAWKKEVKGHEGLYRAALLGQLSGKDSAKNIASKDALRQIFIGMGMFVKSELANERIAVAVLTPSEEDEHSCFSDNTHRDLAQNYFGFKNVLMGEYRGKRAGVALFDALGKADQQKLKTLMDDIEARIAKVDHLAKTRMHFDYQIHPENVEESKNLVTLKNQLRRLGDQMVAVGKAYNIDFSESDVIDPEETVIGK